MILPGCVLGDFNEVLLTSKTTSLEGRCLWQMEQFRYVVVDLELLEISMAYTDYTWWNHRDGVQLVHAKLGRCFGNMAFKQFQLNCHAIFIPNVSLDHHLLKLESLSPKDVVSRNKLTRMEPW